MTAKSFLLPASWTQRPVRIAVVGIGGTGSQFCDQLASMEVTLRKLGHCGFEVTLHDSDAIEDGNIGRQRFTRSDIGGNKAVLLCHRINLFYGLSWKAVPRHYEADSPCRADLIVSAVDKAAFRAELGQAFRNVRTGTLWLDMGNGEVSGNVIFGHLGRPSSESAIRLPNVFDLFPELANMQAEDDEAPSCSAEESIRRQSWPINRVAALAAIELLWTLFRNGRIESHGAFFSLAPMTIQPLLIDPEAWRFMGYGADDHPDVSAAA